MDKQPLNKMVDQIALVVVTAGEEMRIPLAFDGEDKDLKTLYPYMLDMMHFEIESPYIRFQDELKKGRYADLSEEDIRAISKAAAKAGAYWASKASENALAIALRITADLRLRGVAEIYPELMMALDEEAASFTASVIAEANRTKPLVDDLDVSYDAKQVDDLLLKHGLTNATEKSFNPGEGMLPSGLGGDVAINFYDDSQSIEASVQEQLEKLETAEDVRRKFNEMLAKAANGRDAYESQYKPGEGFGEGAIDKGLLSIDKTSEDIYRGLDEHDGLDKNQSEDARSFMESLMAERPEKTQTEPEVNDDNDIPDVGDDGEAPAEEVSEAPKRISFGDTDDEDDDYEDDYTGGGSTDDEPDDVENELHDPDADSDADFYDSGAPLGTKTNESDTTEEVGDTD